jgi:hypothetical protein
MKSLYVYFTVILLTVISCTDFDPTLEFKIDPRLKEYVTSFYQEADERNIPLHKNLIVKIAFLEPDINGRTKYEGRQRIVIINQSLYDYYITEFAPKMDPKHFMLEQLMYHELGHALLARKHCNDCYSIMSQDLSLHEYAVRPEKRQVLIDELFTNR